MFWTLKPKTTRYNNKSPCIKTKGTYDKRRTFRCSRSTIERYFNCPSCFYMEDVIGLKKPPMPGWSLNSAVDELVKDEMTRHRRDGTTPEVLQKKNLKLFHHEKISHWQEKGISFYDENTDIEYYGLVDDVLVNEKGELVIVDTKSTCKDKNIVSSKSVWNNGVAYKRQLEIYSYLFQKNGFPVSSTGYLLYYNAIKKTDDFNGVMKFKITLVPYELDTTWIEPLINQMINCLKQKIIPSCNEDCDYCLYLKLNKTLKKSNRSFWKKMFHFFESNICFKKNTGFEKQMETRKE